MKKILIFTYSSGQGGSELNALKITKLSPHIKFDWVVINNKNDELQKKIINSENINNYFSLDLYSSKSLYFFKCIYSLYCILRKGKYQTIYAVGFMPGMLTALLKSFFKFRFISTRRERMPWVKLYHIPFIKFVDLMSSYIETNSKTIENELKNSFLLRNKVYFIPNIILKSDNTKHAIFSNKQKKYIGNVANVRSQKNIELFLSISLRMIKQDKNLIFILVGKDSLDNKVKKFIIKNKLKNKLILLEDINYDKIFSIYSGLDIFLFTSTYEGSPNVLYEAMFANVPIVASRIFATSELINNGINGYLCNLDKEDEFIEKIKLLIDNKDQNSLIKRNIKEFINRLNQNDIALNIINEKIIWHKYDH